MAVKKEITDQFVSAMFNLAKAIKNESERCCSICGGVNEKELAIIAFIGENTNSTMSSIADDIDAPLSTLTSIVDKLVANKYLTRYNSEQDRRVVKVELAEKGKESYKAFLQQKQATARKVLKHFTDADRIELIRQLNKLAASINMRIGE
jgi:DNA-binding MarR family transcriptional regulator